METATAVGENKSVRSRVFGSQHVVDLAFFLAVALTLYFRFFLFPAIPINPANGDQSIFLHGASRIADGQVIYRDFFEFNAPGTEYFYFILLKIFGQNAILPKLVAVSVGTAFAAVGLFIFANS